MSTFAGVVEGFRSRSGEASFLDRLDDLRGRLIRSALVVAVLAGIGFYITMRYDVFVLGVLTAPIEPYLGGERLKYLNPMDPFFVTLKLGLSIGLATALPYLLHQLWGLVAPLLLPDEKRLIAPAISAGVGLFALGVLFCYFLVLPLMLRFTMNFQTGTLEQSIVIGDYLTLILRMLIVFGLTFELPIVILVATALGVVTPEILASKRRHAIATMLIVSAIVTPPDISSLILMMIPIVLLYEASIVMSRLVVARRDPALAAPEV